MDMLIINNRSKHIEELMHRIKGAHKVDFQALASVDIKDYDAIILSGGFSLEIKEHPLVYREELNLIRTCDKPILGICLGFELVCVAFGEPLVQMKAIEKGTMPITLSEDPLFASLPKNFEAYEAHRWVVPKTALLKAIATSRDGIEAVKHPEKTIYGVQFHPEVLIDQGHAERIFSNFIDIVARH